MSKYQLLWDYIARKNKDSMLLSYEEIAFIANVPLDHSFLKAKKELLDYGFEVKKISTKNETVLFERVKDE